MYINETLTKQKNLGPYFKLVVPVYARWSPLQPHNSLKLFASRKKKCENDRMIKSLNESWCLFDNFIVDFWSCRTEWFCFRIMIKIYIFYVLDVRFLLAIIIIRCTSFFYWQVRLRWPKRFILRHESLKTFYK